MGKVIDVKLKGKVGSYSLDIAFRAPFAGVTAIYGRSGSGKSTLLRGVAGLTRLQGWVKIGDDVWQEKHIFLPVHRRQLGFVFQDASLFDHLTVHANLLYGYRQCPEGESFKQRIFKLLGLNLLLKRSPATLSGGERQRVAIGRALLRRPKILLMDEPLASLDTDAREEILPFLEDLRHALQLPILYITHEIKEVERLADYLLLIENGHLLGAGPLAAVQADPALPLAKNRDAAVSLNGRVDRTIGNGLCAVTVNGATFYLPSVPPSRQKIMRLRIAASDCSLALTRAEDSTILNIVPAIIRRVLPMNGGEQLVVLTLGSTSAGSEILARISEYSWSSLALTIGQSVFVQVKAVALLASNRDHEDNRRS